MVYLFLAEGFEEIEALTVVDLLRRVSIDIKTVSVSGEKMVSGAHGIAVNADISISDVNWSDANMLVLPGGMPGTKNLAACDVLMENVKGFAANGKYIAAICAAPALTFGAAGLLNGKKATCYPGMESHMTGAQCSLDDVVVDGNIITSRGMGTAIAFALKIVELLTDKETADKLGTAIVHYR